MRSSNPCTCEPVLAGARRRAERLTTARVGYGDVIWSTGDCGWVTGHPCLAYGPLLLGCTAVVFEGIPSYPDHGRVWAVVEKYRVKAIYIAPTAIRDMMAHGEEPVKRHDRSSLEVRFGGFFGGFWAFFLLKERLCGAATCMARMRADSWHRGRAHQPGGLAVVQRGGRGGQEACGGHVVAGAARACAACMHALPSMPLVMCAMGSGSSHCLARCALHQRQASGEGAAGGGRLHACAGTRRGCCRHLRMLPCVTARIHAAHVHARPPRSVPCMQTETGGVMLTCMQTEILTCMQTETGGVMLTPLPGAWVDKPGS